MGCAPERTTNKKGKYTLIGCCIWPC